MSQGELQFLGGPRDGQRIPSVPGMQAGDLLYYLNIANPHMAAIYRRSRRYPGRLEFSRCITLEDAKREAMTEVRGRRKPCFN